MFKSIFKLICFIGILAISKSTFSQTTTITYIGQSGIPTASCNVFNPAINVNGVFHSSYAGGVLCDTTNGISLSTTPLSSPKGGTAFVIHYNFIPGNLYAISITAKGNTSLSLNTSVIPNANQFPTNGNLCPPDPNTSSYSTAGYGQMTAKLTNASTGYNIPQFSITGNNVYPYLIIWASGGINNQYIDALSISRIVIENIPIISASATSISCGATTPITFTVSNGATGITGYTWNLGANNGWQYNGSDASPTITTAVNTLTLTPTCGMALSSISATVNTNTGNYNSTTSTITVTQPTINMSIASASGNYSVCNTDNYSIGENAHIDHPVALQTDHPKLLFFQRV